ncbi:MAG TPA: PstS family phosphate ABC transporter substrate-binding protein, partial [Planctomycetota bacterium]|nr:PstS family phosphate ABC transporter substrate-binding protein [Planctomycetota bacterium]
SLPVNDDLEELATYSRMGLPLDVYASISAGEEPVVARVVSKAALITITRGADSRASSVMLAVPKEDVELLVLARELARRRQASFYLSAAPRNAPAQPGNSREQGLRLRQVMSRLGYEIPEKKPEPAAPKVTAAPPPPAEAPAGAFSLPPLPERLAPARILVDGSSTVFLMAKLVRDEFMRRYPGVTIDLMGASPGESPSGTGGGFKKFCYGETDISDASRLIKDDEIRKCAGNDVSFVELPLAYDGISLVVNRENTWAKHLTLTELRAIWAQDSKLATWRDVRPDFPAQPIKLFSPGRDSGTFDFFTEEICGKGASPRPDVVTSEDDEVLVRGIIASPGGLGYFGMAYYIEHKDALRLVGVDSGKGPVVPTNDTVLDGSYSPLSRPLFLYVNARSLRRPEVGAFVSYFLRESHRAAQAVGYIPLPEDIRRLSVERYVRNVEGSMRQAGQQPGTLRAMMARQ